MGEPLTTVPTVFKNVSQVSFSWYDYVLFCVMLGLSALIGIYFGCFGTKQSTADEYLMGNKKMKVFPISVSLIASHVSGITLLAVPADIYRYGASYWLYIIAVLLVSLCAIYVYLPVFFKLRLTSTYEYLERRFDNTIRIFASFLFTLGLFLYLPIVIYIPALALSAATGISIHFITPVVCGVCIFYTTLGGLKAVVWTDTLQFIVTTGAVCTVFVIGLKAGGGFGRIWAKALEGHRLDVFDFNPDPTLRDSFWISTIGLSVFWMAIIAIHQSCVQKFLSVATFRETKLCVIYFALGIILITSISVFTGLMMYARYAECDPFSTGAVKKNDQLLPFYIMDVASHVPGLSGLFIAGIFCAALSTLSASLNCMAGTLFEDFIVKVTGPIFDEKQTAYVLKVTVVVTGVLCTALVYVVEQLGGLLPLCIGLGGVTAGPMLGMFTLGILFPKASSKGTLYGSVIGLLFSGWIVVMAQYYKSQGLLNDAPKPTSIAGCSINSTMAPPAGGGLTTLENFESYYNYTKFMSEDPFPSESNHSFRANPSNKESKVEPFFLFRISYYYYSPIGFAVTMVCGLLISILVKNDDPPVHPDLLSPVVHFMLPAKKLDFYTFSKASELVTINSVKEPDIK